MATILTMGRVELTSYSSAANLTETNETAEEKPQPEMEQYNLKKHHVLFGVLLLALAYLAGVKFPSAGRSLLSKVGM